MQRQDDKQLIQTINETARDVHLQTQWLLLSPYSRMSLVKSVLLPQELMCIWLMDKKNERTWGCSEYLQQHRNPGYWKKTT